MRWAALRLLEQPSAPRPLGSNVQVSLFQVELHVEVAADEGRHRAARAAVLAASDAQVLGGQRLHPEP